MRAYPTLPDPLIYSLSDELTTLSVMAEDLRRHGEGMPHANDPRVMGQRDLLARAISIQRVVDGLQDKIYALRATHNEITIELTEVEANNLMRIAEEWEVPKEIAAERLVMDALEARFKLA